MLTQLEETTVARGLSSSDHDFFARAATVGEPFLRRGLMCYFDGSRVEIVGVPLTASMPDHELRGRLVAVIDEWRCQKGVRLIDYLGPVPIEMGGDEPWPLVYTEDPLDSNVDVFVDLTRPLIHRMKLKQDLRRAERRGIVTTIAHRTILGYEHISLLEKLIRGNAFTTEDAGFLASVVSILRHPATLCFEARCGSSLVGFTVAHQYFRDSPLVVCASFDRLCPGASDVLYAAMLRHYQTTGGRRLGLGYAFDEALLRYKTKWGTAILGRPFFQRSWSREPLGDCDHWPWRLLRLTEESQCRDTV